MRSVEIDPAIRPYFKVFIRRVGIALLAGGSLWVLSTLILGASLWSMNFTAVLAVGLWWTVLTVVLGGIFFAGISTILGGLTKDLLIYVDDSNEIDWVLEQDAASIPAASAKGAARMKALVNLQSVWD